MKACDSDELLTLAGVARELGRSASTVRRFVRSGQLPSQRSGAGSTSPYLVTRSDLVRFRATPPPPRRRWRQLADAELGTAIAALRAGLTEEQAAARAGMTDRALRLRFTALGLQPSDFQPKPPDPEVLDPHERRRRVAALARERQWEREHAAGTYAYSRQSASGRRDLHIMLTRDAWDAVHDEAERRQCSMSSLVADVLYDAGIIPEA